MAQPSVALIPPLYTYLGSTLNDITHVSPALAGVVFSVFGVGMTVGNLVIPRFADRALMPIAGLLLAGSAVALAAYPFGRSLYGQFRDRDPHPNADRRQSQA
jgi:predicted MFS family arabinose efflux permease